ncbi:MAG: nuclear transport factor 2 family protein [Pyrinomonadaceae bacterium]|nr:nuclear transport factor 2 family protein [Pyrinomonadaceae bacterium]MDQ3586193.1 nuclear transport factor 2 family protein [Acidobacteriota bacterium]
MNENVHIVEDIFESFGRGDVPSVLAALSEDVEWFIPGPAEIPYAGLRRGRDEVRQFFSALGSAVDFEQFEPREFIAQDDVVAVVGFERGRVRATGKVFDNPWTMIFKLRGGRVTYFRGYEDTAAVAAAFRAD